MEIFCSKSQSMDADVYSLSDFIRKKRKLVLDCFHLQVKLFFR